MQHISDALNALHDECSWFARAREIRLLVVRTSSDIRTTATRLVPRYEFHADNRSPWVLLEDAYEHAVPQWESRAARLLEDWERRREAFAGEGIELPPAEPRRPAPAQLASSRVGVDPFFNVVVALLDALRPPLDGLVLVLAPTIVGDTEGLDADLSTVLGHPALGGCRIVLITDIDCALPHQTIAGLANAAIVHDCVTDPQQKRCDFDALLGGMDHEPASIAGAWPAGVVPPRRVNARPDANPAERDAALREAGVDPAYLQHAPALRRLILGAALAMGEGRIADAIRLQTDAVRLCAQVGVPQMMVICQIALATYLSSAGDRVRALEELDLAATNAAAARLTDQESQARLAEGLLYALDGRPLDAANAYYRCARIAEGASSEMLAIEAWRLAGQSSLEGGATEQGIQYLQHALAVAGRLDATARATTSASEVARRLAELYTGWGYAAHAEALHAQADAIEAGAQTGAEPDAGRGHTPVAVEA